MKRRAHLHCGLDLSYEDRCGWHVWTLGAGRLSEPKPLYYASLLVRPGDLVVDVGANLGQVTCWHASRGCRVFALEPSPVAFELLAENVNPYGNLIDAWQLAVGAEPGRVRIGAGLNSEQAHVTLNGRGGVEVARVTLDQAVVPRLRVEDHVRLLKVDVEGYELNVLHGALTLLERDHPYVQLEVEARWLRRYGHEPRHLEVQLRGCGYTRFVDHHGRRYDWRTCPTNTVFAGTADHWLPRLGVVEDVDAPAAEE